MTQGLPKNLFVLREFLIPGATLRPASEVEHLVNAKIRENIPLTEYRNLPIEKAKELGHQVVHINPAVEMQLGKDLVKSDIMREPVAFKKIDPNKRLTPYRLLPIV